jgi:Ni/Fe-hydrogenase subunit HybB-like protein
MAHMHLPSDVPVRYLPRSRGATLLAGTMFIVGLVAFIIRLSQDAEAAWIAYVSNWLFFASISMGGVILAVATWITKAKWNWPMRRVSQAMAAFLPIAFVLLLPMLTLRESYFHWIEEMAYDPIVQAKAAYLNIPFLISRNLVGLLLLFGLALYFVYLAVRPDMGLTRGHEGGDPHRAAWRERLTQGWMGQEQEEVHSYKRMTTIAPAIVLLYAVVMSIVSYDWAMSLEPHWFSTMFGPWFFMGAFWGGIAATVLWSLYLRNQHDDFKKLIGLQQRHDLGKLAFAFCVFWTYLWFSQYIVIWYGKLEWEQAWIIRRSGETWGGFSALIMVLCFIVPFAGLMGRKAKMKPMLLATYTTIILVGLWLERYALIAPSLHHEGDPIFTIWQPLIGLMFLGLWLGSVRWFLSTFPAIQVWQPMVDPEALELEQPVEA